MSLLALWPAIGLATLGAFLDVRERRLPNWLCAALAVTGAGALAYTQGMGAMLWALLHASAALIVGMGLFRLGAIGGGDAKFYAAAACSIPAVPVGGPLALLGWTSAAGLGLLVVMMSWRRVVGRADGGLLRGWNLPYGVAIAAGLCITLLRAQDFAAF
jgi:prepilin peptidase CpaA